MKNLLLLLLAGALVFMPVHVNGMMPHGGGAEKGRDEEYGDKKFDPAKATELRTEEEQIKAAQRAALQGSGNSNLGDNREVVEEETTVVSKESVTSKIGRDVLNASLSQEKSEFETDGENDNEDLSDLITLEQRIEAAQEVVLYLAERTFSEQELGLLLQKWKKHLERYQQALEGLQNNNTSLIKQGNQGELEKLQELVEATAEALGAIKKKIFLQQLLLREQARRVSSLKQIKSSLELGASSLVSNSTPATPPTEKPHTIKEDTIPIRKRERASQIEKEAIAAIAKIDQETNEAITQLIGDEQGLMATFFLKEREQKVQVIKEGALQQKQALLKPTSEPATKREEKINLGNQQIEELLQDYKKKLEAIEKKESEALQKIDNDPKTTLRLMRESNLRIEIEKERAQKIVAIRERALNQKNLLFLEATRGCRPYQKDFFLKILRSYKEQFASKPGIFIENQINEIASSIEESFVREKESIEKIVPSSGTMASFSRKGLTSTIEDIEQEEQIRLSILQPCVTTSITQKLETLTAIEKKRSHPFLSNSNQLSTPEKAPELARKVEKIRTDYFVAEAISSDLAQQVAEEAAEQLGKEIEKIETRLTAGRKEKATLNSFQSSNREATNESRQDLELAISSYGTLKKDLEEARQAYKQIAFDCSLRVKDILEFKDHVAILKQASMLVRQGSGNTPFHLEKTLSRRQINAEIPLARTLSKGLPADLATTNFTLQRQVSGNFHPHRLVRIASAQQNTLESLAEVSETEKESESDLYFGLDFLEKLEEIPPEKDSYFLVGKRGEIGLLSFSQANKTQIVDGLHLVRLAIFRDYGAEGLARFDEHFQEKIRLENPITLGELIAFIDEENKKNPSAYYLSPARSLKELIVGEPNEKEESKLINVESTPFTFSITSHVQKISSDNKETFKALQEEIEKFFIKLPELQRKKILERFFEQFEKTEEEKELPLTVGNVRSFLIKEIEKHQVEFANVDMISMLFDHLSPHMETLYAGLITSTGLSVGVMILFDVAKSLLSRLGAFRYVRNMVDR